MEGVPRGPVGILWLSPQDACPVHEDGCRTQRSLVEKGFQQYRALGSDRIHFRGSCVPVIECARVALHQDVVEHHEHEYDPDFRDAQR